MGFLFPSQKVETPTPARMPSTDDEATRAARAKARRSIFERSGRSSTVMTQEQGTGGVKSYTNSLLGSA